MTVEDWLDGDKPPDCEDVECKHCGEDGLSWVFTGVRWRLMGENGRIHVCDMQEAAMDDFEDVS